MSKNKNKTEKWSCDYDIIKQISTDNQSLLSACVQLANDVNVC